MNKPKAPQAENTSPVSRKVGDRNAFLIPHHNHFDSASPAHKDSYLASDFS
ncbi:MAG: hypothetical protein ACE144_07305 [Thermodesulfobacteriota bacterium]